MKKSFLMLPIIAVLLSFSCKEKPVPTFVDYNGQNLYFTAGKIGKELVWADQLVATGATSETDGEANTELIVSVLGEGNYPAKLCADLVEGGFDDWYLPSIDEMKAISTLGDDLPVDYTGTYWTSTEVVSNAARFWYIHFGSQYNENKTYKYDCLCVRKN